MGRLLARRTRNRVMKDALGRELHVGDQVAYNWSGQLIEATIAEMKPRQIQWKSGKNSFNVTVEFVYGYKHESKTSTSHKSNAFVKLGRFD